MRDVFGVFLLLVGTGWGREVIMNSMLELRRDDFPKDFVFGSGTSAYQVEGAAAEDGRTPSIWDTSTHAGGKQTGDIAADGYHKYKDDVKLMGETGLEAYRFSISWTRLIPNGRGNVNPKGLEYYNNLINELITYGIQPHVTLFHYDHPQVLEDEYGGWLNSKIVDDFTAYADVCFKEFGDRVSHWTTLNEPNVFMLGGYDVGILPPNRCSNPFGWKCTHGNSVLEPYIAAHNCLLAHSSAASLYRQKYQNKQKGFIGLNIYVYHFLPLTNTTLDIAATKRAQDFYTGWFVHPIVYGDYPDSMKALAGAKIPRFSENQSVALKGSFDFIGLNYYAALRVENDPITAELDQTQRDYTDDMCAKLSSAIMGKRFDEEINITAQGFQGMLEYLKHGYGNPPIYIHENGYAAQHGTSLVDTPRVKYLSAHLAILHNTLRNGSNIVGYFTWSFLDVFELFGGYESSYGLYYVDFSDKDLKRYPKLSANWYSNFLKRREDPYILTSVI